MAKLDSKEIIRVKSMGFLFDKNSEDKFNARVITENGFVSANQMKVLGEAAERFGNGNVAFTTRLTVEVQGIPFENIEPFIDFLNYNGLETGGTGDKVRPIVACKGKTCVFGLVPSADIAKRIHDRFYKGYRQVELPHKFKIAVGGCPNNCVKPDLNDIGIIGMRKPIINKEICRSCGKCACETVCLMGSAKKSNEDGKILIDEKRCNSCGKCIKACPFGAVTQKESGVRILIGGRWGREGRKGTYISGGYTVDQALDMIEKIILYYRENAYKKERFADMIERIGFDKVERALLNEDIISRKDIIISKEINKR